MRWSTPRHIILTPGRPVLKRVLRNTAKPDIPVQSQILTKKCVFKLLIILMNELTKPKNNFQNIYAELKDQKLKLNIRNRIIRK